MKKQCKHPRKFWIKSGKRRTTYREQQIYRCKKCGCKVTPKSKDYRQQIPFEIKKYAMSLVKKGMSLRKATEETMQVYGIAFTHHSVLRWMSIHEKKFKLPRSRPVSIETRKRISMSLKKVNRAC